MSDTSDTSDTPEQLPADLPEGASRRLAELENGLFTSDLSVNEFLLIKEVGFHPLGFVMGSSIYHTGIQTRKWGESQELTKLTEAMYNARELAMTRMEEEAAELGGLFLHAGHGQLAGVVHGLGELGQLLALAPLPGLDTGVVDRRAHHEAEGVEAHLLDEEELVDREVGGEQPVLELLQAVAGSFRQVGRQLLGGVAGVTGVAHPGPPMTMFSRARRTAWLLAASALSTVSRRLSQVSMSTFSLRMRMPPEEWAMVHRRVFPSTSASNWSSSMAMWRERISSDFRNRPARSTLRRGPRPSESWSTSTLTRMRTSDPSARSDAAASSRSNESSMPLTCRTLSPLVLGESGARGVFPLARRGSSARSRSPGTPPFGSDRVVGCCSAD